MPGRLVVGKRPRRKRTHRLTKKLSYNRREGESAREREKERERPGRVIAKRVYRTCCLAVAARRARFSLSFSLFFSRSLTLSISILLSRSSPFFFARRRSASVIPPPRIYVRPPLVSHNRPPISPRPSLPPSPLSSLYFLPPDLPACTARDRTIQSVCRL